MTIPKRPRRALTPAEHEDWLKATGQYDAMIELHRQQHEEHLARVRMRDEATKPVVLALQDAGCPVSSPYELLRLADTQPRIYLAGLPVLLDHLQRPYPHEVRDYIAFALNTRVADGAWSDLVMLFRKETDERVKDSLANAIEVNSNRERLGELIELIRDPNNGPSRILLLRALTRTRDPRGKETLHEMANDPDLAKEIAFKLSRHKKRMH